MVCFLKESETIFDILCIYLYVNTLNMLEPYPKSRIAYILNSINYIERNY